MKHAYLIMAHNNLKNLKILLELLDNPQNDIYLHFDKNANIKNFEVKLKFSNLFYVQQMPIYWGHYSQIKCEIHLLKSAASKKYDYYHLLSGADLPLKTQQEIHDFFQKNKGQNYISFIEEKWASENKIVEKRVQGYRIFSKFYRRKNKMFNFILRAIDEILVRLQWYLKVSRIEKNLTYGFGANWFSITNEFAEYILSRENWIEKNFKYTSCADEIFMQTLLLNSKFKDKNMDKGVRYIDWKRGNPYVFKIGDLNELIHSEYLFARKFHYEEDSAIIKEVYNYLKGKEKIK